MESLSFYTILLVILRLRFVQVLARSQCESGQFYNGVSCVPCSLCPPGQGVKVSCEGHQDTLCYDCVEKFDYSSNSSRTTPCLICRNCKSEYLLTTARCTITQNTACAECPEGKYFHFAINEYPVPRCLKCTNCGSDEIEISPCTYKSNRKCRLQSTKEPPTTSVTTIRIEKKAKDSADQGIELPIYMYIIIICVLVVSIVGVVLYLIHRRCCIRKVPGDTMRTQPVKQEGVPFVAKPVTEDTHFRDLPGDVRREINIELTRLANKSGPIGITLEAIAHRAGLTNDFIQLRLNNPARHPGDEFIHEFESRAEATLGTFIKILINVEKKYDNGHESYLREYITKVLEEAKHPNPAPKAEETLV